MIILPGCWVCIFDIQKVPEMRNIGLASIQAVWPQLGQNSNVPRKTPLREKFQFILSIGGRFTAPPCPSENLDFALPLLNSTSHRK